MRRSRPGIRVLGYAVVSLCLASQAHAAEPIPVAASYPPWLMWVVLALAVLLWAGSSVMWAAIGLGGDPPVPARLTQGRVTRWIVPIGLPLVALVCSVASAYLFGESAGRARVLQAAAGQVVEQPFLTSSLLRIVPSGRALPAVVLALLTLVFFVLFIREMQTEAPRIESHWGGLGGAMGGWTLSRSFVYLGVFLLFGALLAGVSFVADRRIEASSPPNVNTSPSQTPAPAQAPRSQTPDGPRQK